MKKIPGIIIGLITAAYLAGCASQPAEETSPWTVPYTTTPVTSATRFYDTETNSETDVYAENGYLDLTTMSSTMVYSEVYNMMLSPDLFTGLTVKMEGIFSYYHDEANDREYFACIIQDATACCSQGIEFELQGDYTFPDDYPEPGQIICIEGTFDTYYENGFPYNVLRNAVFCETTEP